MPHAVEMPSFLTDENGPVLSADPPVFDLPTHLRQSYEKVNGVNGNASSTSYAPIKSSPDGGDPYIDVGALAKVQQHGQTDGEMGRDTSLNSLPNGRSRSSSWDQRSSHNDDTYPVSVGTGFNDNGKRNSAHGVSRPVNGNRSSIISNGTIHHTTLDTTPPRITSAPTLDGDSPTIPIAPTIITPNPKSTGPLTYTSSLYPSPPSSAHPILSTAHTGFPSPPRAATASPHRFSSPPSYPAPAAPSQAATSQHAGTTTLKHRHTLQVPKVGTARTSREEDPHSSGRFSPTAVASGVRGSLSLNRRATQSLHSNMPHDEVPPDEDAVRWAEAVRQKRVSKRKRKEDEDDDRVVVGTKVDQHHVNWVTAYNMLTGIRFTVSRTNAKLDRPLTDADFEAKHKFSFDITGNELTPSAKYDFKFKDYAPWVFRHLRAKFKLDPADYLMSLTAKYILSELGSPGKSGSFFYFSRDYKYIIKTIHHGEHKFLRKVLRDYYHHIEENPNTLLSQFYGLHRVKIPYGRKIHFVVMNNLFPPHRDIHKTFDLKGSTIGRDFKEEDLEKNPRATLKDLNWLRRGLHFEFGAEKKKLFIEQMEKDVELLQRLKIMDYSMLVGIHDLQRGNQDNLRGKTLRVFQPGGETPSDDIEKVAAAGLARTPSKLETARKARELRQIIKQEKPIPMGQSSSPMPEQMEENPNKKDFIFYSDDGGFRATHEDNTPGDEILFLSIIDCLTHYGTVKKLEHLWKGLSHDKKLISPIAPIPYGDRFKHFIEGLTKTPEEAAREPQPPPAAPNRSSDSHHHHLHLHSHDHHTSNSTHVPPPPSVQRSQTVNSTIQRAENEAVRSEADDIRHSGDDRVLSAVRVSKDGNTTQQGGQILPVVEEDGEGASGNGSVKDDGQSGWRTPPPPPPQPQDRDRRRSTNSGIFDDDDEHNGGAKRPISRCSLDKELPPLPLPLPPPPPPGSMAVVQDSDSSSGPSRKVGKEKETRTRELSLSLSMSPPRFTASPEALQPS